MKRVYLIETPNATMAGDSVRPARKGEPGAEEWVKKAELDRLVVAARNASDTWRRHGGISMGQMDDIYAALPPPPSGDDEGEAQ